MECTSILHAIETHTLMHTCAKEAYKQLCSSLSCLPKKMFHCLFIRFSFLIFSVFPFPLHGVCLSFRQLQTCICPGFGLLTITHTHTRAHTHKPRKIAANYQMFPICWNNVIWQFSNEMPACKWFSRKFTVEIFLSPEHIARLCMIYWKRWENIGVFVVIVQSMFKYCYQLLTPFERRSLKKKRFGKEHSNVINHVATHNIRKEEKIGDFNVEMIHKIFGSKHFDDKS